jgi:hypothetical protein
METKLLKDRIRELEGALDDAIAFLELKTVQCEQLKESLRHAREVNHRREVLTPKSYGRNSVRTNMRTYN